ncbi:uncharacterized protein B0I36DRAFT_284571 [Microdochium trichocladiopsis]|uniref:Uncharacterized protein n=1 Tax=Microdochium trichocladiopsis TaxID=1682393 RepID=A0A9P8YI59_9PEZI|nr:uncharacterized protein B0I36DRAFT_284571 [Microdochium trichocladiopsis]KAH7038393.1 hypothetical protein B0I36DRAFT_284571 [Microdochium trichocladiopsis]
MTIMKRFTFFIFALQLFGICLAQDAPLFIQGGLEGAGATDDSYNSGGVITVNGFAISVPKNLLVQFPAAYVPFKDFAADQASMLGYEVNVIGNFINGVPWAAQIITYQFFEGLSSGFIESLNYAEGTIKIRAGPTLRISDPNAVFSVGYSGAPFFTADDESPSISSFSGFPMCIPRNTTDPLCPLTNRPFQGSGTFSAPNPLVMVPFLPGDFVTFSGIKRGNEVICFSIVANNVQVLTLQNLVYVRMELGLLGIANFNPNTELAESRFIGFTSNNRARIALYAMDIDPCTGATTDRIIAEIGLKNNEQNKFEFRADILGGYARDYRAVAEIDGVPRTRLTSNGLLAGTYVQPINVWVHGEQVIPGSAPPPNDFSEMPWLTRGVGVDENGNLWGPLEPFPQTGVLIDVPNCANAAIATADIDGAELSFTPSSVLLAGGPPPNVTVIESRDLGSLPRDSPPAKRVASPVWLPRGRASNKLAQL